MKKISPPQDSKSTLDYNQVMIFLRKNLKTKGYSYKTLSSKLGMSESGLKKIFNGKDSSFSRVVQITQALGLRLADVLNEVDQPQTKKIEFSKQQQEFFIAHPALFRFFFRLVIERQTIESMKNKDKLSDKTIFKYLKKLDELNLIQLLPEGKIRLPSLKLIRDFGSGPLLDKLYQDWGRNIVHQLAHPEYQSNSNFIIRCVHMKPETYSEMLMRLREIDEEFLRRGIREMSLSMDGLHPIRWMSLTDQKSFVDYIE